MKHAYLSFKVAKNMLKENNHRKSTIASFISKLESIWPSNSMRNLDRFYVKPEHASIHEEGHFKALCSDFFRNLFCCFFRKKYSMSSLFSLMGQFMYLWILNIIYCLFSKFSAFIVDLIVQYFACILGLLILIAFYKIYLEISFSVFLCLIVLGLVIFALVHVRSSDFYSKVHADIDDDVGIEEYPPKVTKKVSIKKVMHYIKVVSAMKSPSKSSFSQSFDAANDESSVSSSDEESSDDSDDHNFTF